MDTDVLIVGAGPVGMTLALTLRKFGARVTIVDREPKTGRYTRAAILWSRSLEILDLLGIVDDWSREGVSISGIHLEIDGHRADVDLSHIPSPYPHPLGVGQDRTEAVLDARLRASGADYRRGVDVQEIAISPSGITATLETETGDRSLLTAHWVVGCEGSHSKVRDATGIARHGNRNEGVQIVQGDALLMGPLALEPGKGYLHSSGERSALFLLPVTPDGHYRVLCTVPDDGASDPVTLEYLQSLARVHIPGLTLRDPLWLNRFRTQQQIAETYRSGRAFIAGDAAHVWVPIGGQGMNVGLQDAFDLGWKLGAVIAGQLPETLLDTYTTERRPQGVGEIEFTAQMYRIMLQHRTPLDTALRALMPRLAGLAPVAERAATHLSELDVRYPTGLAIARDHVTGHGAVPGERAPDAYVARADTGETTRLFDLYRSGKWIALGWCRHRENHDALVQLLEQCANDSLVPYLVDATPDGVGDVSSQTCLRDLTRRAADAYGVIHDGIHLVRPDGIIAYRGPLDSNPLMAFLHPLFGSQPTKP